MTRRRGLPGWATQILSVLAALAGIGVIWTFVSLVVLSPERRFLLPPPHEVLATLGNPTIMQPMLAALGRTSLVALLGLALAVVIGLAWAVVMAQSRWAERILYPYAVILQTVPILALTPLIGIWFGYGIPARVVVAVIIAIFPVISNTFFGLTSAPSRASHDLFTLARATRWQRLTKLQAPAAVPSVFTGLRTAAGLSVIGAIVGDFFFQQGDVGIGGLLRVYTLRLNMEALLTAVGLTALFGVVVFSVFAALDRAVVGRWYGSPAGR
ncbi:ABC transporter permease [Serinibacter arcticus]|uniref:ABC transporter permease n=1 Tax=Serinibacter arcticus TaxID=1655435 RepID=UPI001F3B73AC|nr:ABC transporter permease subunit [Serinibacter arcticus]